MVTASVHFGQHHSVISHPPSAILLRLRTGASRLTLAINEEHEQRAKHRRDQTGAFTGLIPADGASEKARHERTDDGVNWVPSMDVTLRKVE